MDVLYSRTKRRSKCADSSAGWSFGDTFGIKGGEQGERSLKKWQSSRFNERGMSSVRIVLIVDWVGGRSLV